MYGRGLLLDGEHKSIEPMASRLGESDQDLHHFVGHSPWSADGLLEALAKATATTPPAYWITDETSFPKAGQHSAGGQCQYGGALGKDGQLPDGGEPAPRRHGGGHEPAALLAALFARELGG